MRVLLASLALAAVVLCCARPAAAAPIAVVNPGFEDISGESVSGEFTFGPFNGWQLYDPDVITGGGAGGTYYVGTLTPFEPNPVEDPGVFAFFPDGAPEGDRVMIAFNFEGSGGQGEYGLRQTLGEGLLPNSTYRLQVEICNIASGTSMGGGFFDLDGFPGYRVDLLAGEELLASDDNLLAGTIPNGQHATSTVTFTTGTEPPAGNLEIRLVNLNQVDALYPDSDLEVDFDDVRLEVLPALAGDYNFDGVVDAADYTTWLDNLGSVIPLPNDTTPGSVTLADYQVWRGNFGASSGSASQAGAPVPEPSGLVLLLVGLLAAVGRRR